MDREQIKNILPHREPMLLVDESYLEDEGKAHGKYTVRGDEFFVQGHFPGTPVVPGVILCEMASQSACAMTAEQMMSGKLPLFAGMNNVRFKTPVRPGDTVEFECELKRKMAACFVINAKGTVGGKLCMSGEFTFFLVDKSALSSAN